MSERDSTRRTFRLPSRRRSPVWAVATAASLTLLVGTLSPPASTAQGAGEVASIALRFEAARRDPLLSGGAPVPASQLFAEALTVNLDGTTQAQVVVFAFRIRGGSIVSRFESRPFPVTRGAGALAQQLGALPEPGFYGGAAVGRDGIAGSTEIAAAAGASDPVRFVVSAVTGKPADWHQREAIYAIAVPADEGLRGRARATPVVVFSDEVVTLTATPGGAGGTPKDAAGILRRVAQADQLCGGWVQDYTLYRVVEGFVIPEYYERDGAGPGCRKVPITEYMDRFYEQAGLPPPRWSHGQADSLNLLGDGLKQGIAGAGVPAIGNLAQQMTGLMADFVRAGADIDPTTLMPEDARQRAADFAEFVRRARYVGTETVDGRQAYHLRAEGLEDIALEQAQTGPPFTLKAASLWVDTEMWVPLGMRFEGVSEERGETEPIAIAMAQEGWTRFSAPVPGGGVLFPTRVVMRITGIDMFPDKSDGALLTDGGDRAQIQKAAADAAKLRGQLDKMDKMPAFAKKMMLAEIEKLERMAAPGRESIAEYTVDLLHAVLNEGPPYPGGTGSFRVGGIDFPNAMVLASWREEVIGDTDLSIVFIDSLEFQGRVGEGAHAIDGWLTVSTDRRPLSEQRPQRLAYGTIGLNATAQGRYQRNGNPPTASVYEEEKGEIQLLQFMEQDGWKGNRRWSLTRQRGFYFGGTYEAAFDIGHMPCSTAPRSITHVANVNEDCRNALEQNRAAAGSK